MGDEDGPHAQAERLYQERLGQLGGARCGAAPRLDLDPSSHPAALTPVCA